MHEAIKQTTPQGPKPIKLAYEMTRLSTEEPEEQSKEADQTQAEAAISLYLFLIGEKGRFEMGDRPGQRPYLPEKRREIVQEAARKRLKKK